MRIIVSLKELVKYQEKLIKDQDERIHYENFQSTKNSQKLENIVSLLKGALYQLYPVEYLCYKEYSKIKYVIGKRNKYLTGHSYSTYSGYSYYWSKDFIEARQFDPYSAIDFINKIDATFIEKV